MQEEVDTITRQGTQTSARTGGQGGAKHGTARFRWGLNSLIVLPKLVPRVAHERLIIVFTTQESMQQNLRKSKDNMAKTRLVFTPHY